MAKAKAEPNGKVGSGTTRIVSYLVTGTYDLLMHNPASMYYSAEGELAQKKIPTAEEEAAASRYVTEDNLLYIPAQGIRNSIVSGGKGRRIGKLAAPTVLRAGVFPAEDRAILQDAKTGKPMTGDQYVIDVRRVVLKKSGGIMRARAKVSNWMFKVAFEVDALVSDGLIEEAGNIAGRIVGLLDYRPEKSGPFGRYKMKLIS